MIDSDVMTIEKYLVQFAIWQLYAGGPKHRRVSIDKLKHLKSSNKSIKTWIEYTIE